MNTQLQTLLRKEMTRKEFLTTLGLAVASILGFSSVIRLLNSRGQHAGASHSYGSSGYGV
ncbi:MAG TPA: hypothetical protein VLH84_04140 [Patescibacteria group bacterium]|nr:hypothetical protein [Patescibacteria group bacterium]